VEIAHAAELKDYDGGPEDSPIGDALHAGCPRRSPWPG